VTRALQKPGRGIPQAEVLRSGGERPQSSTRETTTTANPLRRGVSKCRAALAEATSRKPYPVLYYPSATHSRRSKPIVPSVDCVRGCVNGVRRELHRSDRIGSFPVPFEADSPKVAILSHERRRNYCLPSHSLFLHDFAHHAQLHEKFFTTRSPLVLSRLWMSYIGVIKLKAAWIMVFVHQWFNSCWSTS